MEYVRSSKIIRKEVWMNEDKIPPLQAEALKRGWSLKQLIEFLIIKESDRLREKQSKKYIKT